MCCSVPPYVKASRQRSRDAAGPNAYPPCFCCVQRGMVPGVLRMVQCDWTGGPLLAVAADAATGTGRVTTAGDRSAKLFTPATKQRHLYGQK